MERLDARTVGGILLIVFGVVFLLQTLGIVPVGLAFVWGILFGLAGLAFVYVFLANRASNWWALIPGFTLLGLAGVVALAELGPPGWGEWGGALFLGAIGLSFWVIYLQNRAFWWAIIPGGVLFTLALIVSISFFYTGAAIGGIFFFGLGATFLLVSLAPTPEGRPRWALIPAAILLTMGLIVTAAATALLSYLVPAVLILIGLYLLLRSRTPRQETSTRD